jgi:DHA1 family tetracycline resistance protein-like MFS transporter
MRKASLGTLFVTVFLDLLGFGLVVPFLPGVARAYGASNLEATLLGAAFSGMQFLFIPLWGRLSDRVGRRPVLLWSIAASAIGMGLLGLAGSLAMLFVARLWSGMATANIAVAQAYIADVTTPERRARGMGLIGMAFGLGFIFGPFIGGELGRFAVLGRPGALAAFVAAGLSAVNLVMALFFLPESRPAAQRGPAPRRRAAPLDLEAARLARATPGVPLAVAIGFSVTLWFSAMEQTFRLFTDDAFGMTVATTGRVFGLVGIVTAVVQGGLIHRLTRRFGEIRLVRAGAPILGAGLALLALSPSLGGRPVMIAGSCLLALGYGLLMPSLSSYTSRQAAPEVQGSVLGVFQSTGALARAVGPAAGGLLYQLLGMRAPYVVGALGMFAAGGLALRLPPLCRPAEAVRRAPA